jgi:hypothetical protein
MKIQSIPELYHRLPENERLMVDVLRQIIQQRVPDCREKLSWNVPVFRRNKTLCIVWPASIPRGGIREGVLLGFWFGNRLRDEEEYLCRGTNKQIYYKVFLRPEEIDEQAVVRLLEEAVKLDESFRKPRTGQNVKA